MNTITIILEKSADFYDAYSEEIKGIYGAGASIDEVKADVEKSIAEIKANCAEEDIPEALKGEYELQYKLDPASFIEYYASLMSLSGLERITGINQKQLSNYLNHRAKPREKQLERIRTGLRSFAHEMLTLTL